MLTVEEIKKIMDESGFAFKKKFGHGIDWKNPKTFNEKLKNPTQDFEDDN